MSPSQHKTQPGSRKPAYEAAATKSRPEQVEASTCPGSLAPSGTTLLYYNSTPRIYIFRWFKFQPTTEFLVLAKAARRIVCSRGCCESHI
jgi:hypothetical protein